MACSRSRRSNPVAFAVNPDGPSRWAVSWSRGGTGGGRRLPNTLPTRSLGRWPAALARSAHRSRSVRSGTPVVLAGRVARQAACAASGPEVPAAVHGGEDLAAAGGELAQQVRRDAVDLRDPLDRCGPGQPEVLGELAA